MTPLTPEQVELLRLPLGLSLRMAYGSWIVYQTRDSRTGTDYAMADLASRVANGHLPPESLDDVWRRVEGKPSREAELLRNLVEWYDAASQAQHVANRYHSPPQDKDDEERFKVAGLAVARFTEELQAAREWIEERKP